LLNGFGATLNNDGSNRFDSKLVTKPLASQFAITN